MDAVTVLLSKYPKYPARRVRTLARQIAYLNLIMNCSVGADETIMLRGIIADLEGFHLLSAAVPPSNEGPKVNVQICQGKIT